MVSDGKAPAATIAAFAFALLYVGFILLVQLPVLVSRPIPPSAQREVAARNGAIVGLLIECAAIGLLGFGILKKRMWAGWWLLGIAVIEIMLDFWRQEIRSTVLPSILLILVLWAINSLRIGRVTNTENPDSY
jgi:hypothetical protein